MDTKKTLRRPRDLHEQGLMTADQARALTPVTEQFSMAITPAMRGAIDTKAIDNDPVARQFIPSPQELSVAPEEREDPIGDHAHEPVKGIIHRHPDRCLLQPVSVCPVYCRFCFRREDLGQAPGALTPAQLEAAYAYIRQTPSIWEVILTGGDPLILKPQQLQPIIAALNAIPHVGILRIHTRVPVVDPDRINTALLQVLATSTKPIYLVLHCNHANEITPAAANAITALIDHGVVMLSQTVLLAGINDNIAALSALMKTLLTHRVKPYYLHHLDLAKGTGHFRTSIAAGRRLAKALRTRFSGLCQPTYVIDIPGGYGKIPIGHHYLSTDPEQPAHVNLEDHHGHVHRYHDLAAAPTTDSD